MFRENIGPIFLTVLPAILLSYFLSVALPSLRLQWKTSHIPIINKKKGEWSDSNAVKRCAHNAQAILQEGYEKVDFRLVEELPSKITDQKHQYTGPFQFIGSFGRRIVLPPELGEHIKTDPRFTASEVVRQTMAGSLPGFEGLLPVMEAGAPNVFIQMIRSKLTSNLGIFIL
jgi:hypothetical protein